MFHWTFFCDYLFLNSGECSHSPVPPVECMDQRFRANLKLLSQTSNFFLPKRLDHVLLPPVIEMQINSSSLSFSWNICHHPNFKLTPVHNRRHLSQTKKYLSLFFFFFALYFALRNLKHSRLLLCSGCGGARIGWNHITCEPKTWGARTLKPQEKSRRLQKLVCTATRGHVAPKVGRAWDWKSCPPEGFTLPMRSGCRFPSSYNQPPVSLSFSEWVSAPCNRKSLTKHKPVPKGTAFYI